MISRRDFLIACLAAAGSTCFASNAKAKAYKCRPTISGPLWWMDQNWDISRWRDELDEQSRIGFNLLWLLPVHVALSSDQGAARLHELLDLCAKRKVRVILDTGSSGMWYSPFDIDNELKICGRSIELIGQHFKGHPAFYAWYVPQEIYMEWPDKPGYEYIFNLYPALVEKCKKAADLPVTVSPFFILDKDKIFGDFRYNEPDEYEAFWTKMIKKSNFDIVMLQDSGEHFSYVTNDMRRPFFEAMYNACKTSGAKFWGNVETAEYVCPSIEEFVKRYGKIHHSTAKGLPWRPVPIDRLKEKLELAAEYSEEIVTWGYREFCRPELGEDASKWYKDYKSYYKNL